MVLNHIFTGGSTSK